MAKFNIGDVVWVAGANQRQVRVFCPECLGSGRLRVILGDDTEVSIECVCCRDGYNGSPGSILVYEFGPTTRPEVVAGIEEEMVEGKLRTRYKCQGWTLEEDLVFATKEDAEARSQELIAAHEADEKYRLKCKERKDKTWAWNVHYHRREIRDLKKKIAYHESKLSVAPKIKKGAEEG